MGKVRKRKSLVRRKNRRRSSKKFIVKKNILKTVAMDINKPNVSAVEVEEDDNDNSLPTDEHKSMKMVSSKVTLPTITNHQIIDIIDITDISADGTTLENFQPVDHKKTALNIDNDEIIDITDITITSNKYENVPRQFSSDTILFDDDVQIIDVQNKSIELITISDDSDEENIPNQQSIEMPNRFKSVHERLGISTTSPIRSSFNSPDNSDEVNTSNQQSIEMPNSFKSVHERLGISTTGPIRSSYNSPLRNRKRKREEENITKLDCLGENLGLFVIDKQKMSARSNNYNRLVPKRYTHTENLQMLEQKKSTVLEQRANQISKSLVSSKVTTSTTNRKLRPIIIDGLNIGFAHGSGTFSGKGIELCVQFFTDLGHKEVIAFIPQHRQGPPGSESNIILNNLDKKGQICFTPSRKVQNLRMTCHDDRIILNYAHKCDGVVVSNDNYRDLYNESEAFKEIIENRQVMVTFVKDLIIVPEDQYNRRTTIRSLSDILSFPE